jgi:hypothetical protein
LVLLHHSVVNYTYFGRGDKAHWLGFDLVVLFNDSFFMACMLLISGLFVHQSLKPWGPTNFLANRALRLGVSFLLSIFVLMPLPDIPSLSPARHDRLRPPSFLVTYLITVGPWPSGPAWFLWVLLAFDAVAALVWRMTPGVFDRRGKATYALRYQFRVPRVPGLFVDRVLADAPTVRRRVNAETPPPPKAPKPKLHVRRSSQPPIH